MKNPEFEERSALSIAAQERAKAGKRTCSYVLGYDTDGPDRLEINERETEIVRFIFSDFLETKNLSHVAERCEQRGYKGKRNSELTAQHIKIILQSKLYLGFYRFHGEWFDGNFEPIIEVAQ